MATTLVLLGLGWWLVAPSGVQGESRPSLSLHPSEGVAVGDTVTLRCRVPRLGVRVLVYREAGGTYRWYEDGVEDTAEFSVKVLDQCYAGRYRCRFEILDPSWASEPSDPVELVVLESRPSLSLHPSEEVALGDMVTLRCCVPRPGFQVVVYKEGDETYRWHRDGVEDTAEFSVEVLTRNYAGRYRCRFETLDPSWTLEPSDPVELLVLDTHYPPPRMSLSPEGRVGTGTNVTIQCQSTYRATFVLHKAGSSVPIRRQDVDRGDTATFVLPGVTPSDAGTYGCSYRTRRFPFVSSHPRAEVTLEVEPGGAETTSPLPRPPESRPSLSLRPSEGVALGDMVTLRCCVPQRDVRVVVYKEGNGTYRWIQDRVKDMAEFSMRVLTRNYAGRYRCRFQTLDLSWTSEPSDPAELLLLAAQYPPPTMSLSPGGRVGTGTNVTIRCQSTYGATFVLHKAGSLVPIRRQDVDRRDTATFVLPGVTPSDAGTYGCSYRPHGFPFISSYRSTVVTLEVEPGGPSKAPCPLAGTSAPCSGPPGDEEEKSSWNLAVVGGCAAALLVVVVIVVIVFLAAAPCCRRRRGKGPTVEPSRDPPELLSQDMVGDSSQDLRSLQLLEDAEGLTYAELRPPAPGAPGDRDAPSPSVIYAQVGGRGPC